MNENSVMFVEASANTNYGEDTQFKFVIPTIVQGNQFRDRGLGRSSKHIHSTLSLLLFRTNENPYHGTIGIDNLEWKHGKHEKHDKSKDESYKNISAAPHSIEQYEYFPEIRRSKYVFTPDQPALLALDLPTSMPNLENIA